jgi:hypothetical protein
MVLLFQPIGRIYGVGSYVLVVRVFVSKPERFWL